ncbi:tripartite tricarboxylate transporter substrate binding protein [Marinomonas sp. 15G1-11]|uniref:Tripartite tricarboxylate transporter substrate binding protein n=1 Tax=Marinomonas phaeophyticola TaxID=3004091 RepID=A0ABT4JRE2_9GAMM|nr:tripartite tricarboxylate transporter substrate binding protein [Marinomonas sp. 15G1-11]MCZ2720393.1 tripartite tricarboxylate transporter substrate binding protein [Marinomonas sp. 15G1-11]
MKNKIKSLLISSLVITSATMSYAANNYPENAVRIIVPYSAGGGSDSVSRALAEALKPKFPEGIAVENRTGGAGSVGMSYGMHAKPNGETITMVAPELVMLPHSGNGGDIDYKKFKHLAIVNSGYAAITVPADSPYQTLDSLLNDAKDKNLLFGNSGTGSIWHIAGVGMEKAAEVEFTHIPFKGSSAAITSLLGKHLDAVSVSYAEVASQVDAGLLRTLAVLAPHRLIDAPNIPTAKELGYDVAIGTWRGYSVPLETPDYIVNYLTDAILEAAESDEFKTFMAVSNNDIDIIGPEEFEKKVQREDTFYAELISGL